jgi:hypothetical protein
LSVALPENPLGDYLDVESSVMQWGADLEIGRLKIGCFDLLHTQLQQVPEYVAALDAINGYSISPNQLKALYHWQPDLVK